MYIKKIAQTPELQATVIDNLDSESSVNALSAKQGKVLNEKTIKVSSTEPTNENVWFKKGKNILKLTPQTKSSEGVTATINNDGSVTLDGTATGEVYISFSTERMYVEGAYTFGLTTDISDYFESNFLEIGCYVYGTDGKYNRNLTTKATPTQIIEKGEFISLFSIYCNKGAVYNNFKVYPQIEAGTQATEFEAYIEKEIYIKNANGVFEEFNNNRINIITDAEVATNEYIDGRRLYVKRVDCGYLNAGNVSIPHNITNLKSLIRYKGTFKNENSGTLFNIPRSYTAEPEKYNVDCDISATNINITAGTNFNGSLFKAYIEIYYTKN